MDVPPLLVTTITQFGCKSSTGGTGDITVTGVEDRMVTRMRTTTRLRAVGRSGTTWYWRVEDTSTTVTGQLIKANIITSSAFACVTKVLAVVQFICQIVVRWK